MAKADVVEVVRYRVGVGVERCGDELAVEEPLEVRVKGRAVSVTMRTPGGAGEDEELAIGFLAGEGMVRAREDVIAVEHCVAAREGNVVNVVLHPRVWVDFARLARNVFVSSSCGICGKASIEAVEQVFEGISGSLDLRVSAGMLLGLGEKLRAGQETFARTGGLHAAGVFDLSGKLLCVREDVGRHNAVDKVVGWGVREGRWPFERDLLVVSGRASFEIMQKALGGRFPVVVAVSAPSGLAVEFAKESGQTLVGFLREGRMNVYAGEGRVVFE